MTAALLALAMVSSAGALPPAGAAPPAATAVGIDVQVLYEDFEGAFPGTAWRVNDTNPKDGIDTWAASTYRAAAGTASAWSAGSGNQTSNWSAPWINASAGRVTNFTEDFEGGSLDAAWSVSDGDSGSNDDYWGISTARAYGGTSSLWSAQVGYNDEWADDNVNVSLYDNSMDALVWRAVNFTNLSNSTSVFLQYWYWLDSESGYDYFHVTYYDGSQWVDSTGIDGYSGGWQFATTAIPNDATRIGFRFVSDTSVLYEGVYVDDIELYFDTPAFSGPFEEDFEGGSLSPNWTVTGGDDTWGLTTYRSNAGTTSLWCAQVGYNSEWADTNANVNLYDNSMATLVWRSINTANLSNFPGATFEYSYWLDSESGYDYFAAVYYSGTAWTELNSIDGSSGGWVSASFTVPNDTTRIGFKFTSDSSVVQEGVYIDDVRFYATRAEPNTALRTYDTSSNATMVRNVLVGAYASARIDYSYWMEGGAPNDTLEAMYFVGGSWTYADLHTGSSTGWQSSSVPIPTNTTQIGFRFVADALGHLEGAYIDDVRVWGTVLPINCTATVSAFSGFEALTVFQFQGSATEGLRPYSWSWQFGDGNNSSLQNPLHAFTDVGNFTAALTVRDAIGQTCIMQAPTVAVLHDTSTITMTPATASLTEGDSALFVAADARGHPLDFDWAVQPSSCGAFDSVKGPSATFTADTAAGGSACTVTASEGAASGAATVSVTHDTSAITIDPPSATILEGGSVTLSAADAFGHGLVFAWTTTCGSVGPSTGSGTTFTADTTGALACTVTARLGTDESSALITVLHDTTTITVSPPSATVFEGASQTFSANDAYGHPLDGTWSVDPSSCGTFSTSVGPLTSFDVSSEAGGSACTVTVSSGANQKSAAVAVLHDARAPDLLPMMATVTESSTQVFAVTDAYGHPVSVSWSLSPLTCGALSPTLGPSTTFSSSTGAGGSLCTVEALSGTLSVLARVTVLHGSPASIEMTSSALEGDEGDVLELSATVFDASNHTLPTAPIAWTATCGSLSSASGRSTSLALPLSSGGQSCVVTATQGALSASVSILVHHKGPFTLVVNPDASTVPAGASQTLTAAVTDAYGHEIDGAQITWTSTCGALSSTTGPNTVFTAPTDLGGATCTVTATADAVATPAAATLTAPMSMLLPLGIILPIVGAVAALLFLRRRKKAAAAPQEAAGLK